MPEESRLYKSPKSSKTPARRTLISASLLLLLAAPPTEALAQPPPKPQATAKAAPAAKPADKPKSGKPQAASSKSAKPSKKPAAKPKNSSKTSKKPQSRKPGSEPGQPDERARRVIAGGSATPTTRESPELSAIRELDLALFPPNTPSAGPPWEAGGSLLADAQAPRISVSGMPMQGLAAPPVKAPAVRDLSWLGKLNMPDIPVRWDERVIRYLEYYRDNPRGRSMVASWVKRSGKYSASIRRILAENHLPEDILWLSLVESGFDPTIFSPVGAAGLWQFMPDGARIYGLAVDRWIDERLDPERSTLAAARYLSDLFKRFGTWELAFAAYNMGYGGLLASIRKYNTNDFWELSRLEAGMPLETALYVPKIVAMAIVARNKDVFGCNDVELEPAIAFDKIAVGSAIPLETIAGAAGSPVSEISALNPQFLAGRTPPSLPNAPEGKWVVRVPPGQAAQAAKSMPSLLSRESKLERRQVRWGESLEDIAAFRRTPKGVLQRLNGLKPGEILRPGTVILVPAGGEKGLEQEASARPVVVVPAESFVYANRKRIFYRVVAGDTIRELSRVLGVSADELCRWNTLDPAASLHEGMTLQVYVPSQRNLGGVLAHEEKDVRLLAVGSGEFFDHFESLKGRKRLELKVQPNDTFRGIAKRYGISVGMLERINHRSRSSPLRAGEQLVVYTPNVKAGPEKAPDEAGEPGETAVASTSAGGEEAVKPALLLKTSPEDGGEDDEDEGKDEEGAEGAKAAEAVKEAGAGKKAEEVKAIPEKAAPKDVAGDQKAEPKTEQKAAEPKAGESKETKQP